MTDITKQLAEALRHIENAATDLRVQRYEIRAAASEALAAFAAQQSAPSELPPLPEPYDHFREWAPSDDPIDTPGFTADQMHSYARAALASQPAARVVLTGQERDELERLRALVNTPELHDFSRAVVLEAAHQRERWGSDHDAGKAPEDWFWLLGYLGGKALAAHSSGNTDKALHHTISSAAALANWHAAISGTHTAMRPGIDPVARGITAPAAGEK